MQLNRQQKRAHARQQLKHLRRLKKAGLLVKRDQRKPLQRVSDFLKKMTAAKVETNGDHV